MISSSPPSLLCLLPLLLLSPMAAAQRPQSAAAALERFQQVADKSEAERRRAVTDLGDFADAAVTAALLAELPRAEELGYRQTVVRALGKQVRPGAVAALQGVLQAATNPRLQDSAAEGLARQGEAGVQALGEALAACKDDHVRRNAICAGLGRAEGEQARDLLVTAARQYTGRDRLPPLRALRGRGGDPTADELRLALARDKDPLVAATALQQLAEQRHADAPALALELSRRLPGDAQAELHTAVLHGLLAQPTVTAGEALLTAAAKADDPFGGARDPLWREAIADQALVAWLGEAASNRKAAAERVIAITALGLVAPTHQPAVAAVLQRLLSTQKAPEVGRATAAALVAVAPAVAREPLQRLLDSGAEAMVPVALDALHTLRADEPAWRTVLLEHANGKTASGRAAALRLLARCQHLDVDAGLSAATTNLAHKSWFVRAAAIDLLAILRAPAGIPLLFERLELEHARLRADLDAALRTLTRLQFPTVIAWRDWWSKEGARFQVPPREKPAGDAPKERRGDGGGTAAYWNIPVHSERVVFVVDCSGSMNQPFGTGSGTRLDEAKRQLLRALEAMPDKARANVLTFGNEASGLTVTLQPLGSKHRKAAAAHVAGLEARGATNVHAALELAFADPEVDTVFLLTDGRPSAGAIVEPEALLATVRQWNLGRSVRIHTVAIGGKSEFLERLAADAGGEHTVAR